MTTAGQHSTTFPGSALIPWNASIAAPAFPSVPSRRFLHWMTCPRSGNSTELNESYVKAGKFTPEEYDNHQVK